ncbi:DUF2846 domain-containing protein [Marinimicrobium sp. ABcell2]|uniref:DUF2846 domain-containing protein n=1 Tax=Marinimicrobium sp. ABcell2 TaxID=3069751 RepID=UPI0027B7D936|nr:DUF2846 domain-containing protein [Marinimicrobium sp. ABcell2]MDQ2077740.1 DUF2846 domain-containing protein [Marinimicrobium sp. ABcell2]
MKRTVLLVSALLLASCASVEQGSTFGSVAESDNALLYLYRTKRTQIGGGSPVVRLNSDAVGKVANGGYIAIRLQPGENIISADKNAMDWNVDCPTLVIDAKPGEVYFSKFLVGQDAVNLLAVGNLTATNIKWNCAIPLVDRDVALSELSGLTANSKHPDGIVN